jgi:hypothetical protein
MTGCLSFSFFLFSSDWMAYYSTLIEFQFSVSIVNKFIYKTNEIKILKQTIYCGRIVSENCS